MLFLHQRSALLCYLTLRLSPFLVFCFGVDPESAVQVLFFYSSNSDSTSEMSLIFCYLMMEAFLDQKFFLF
jgi:hypothetical protein